MEFTFAQAGNAAELVFDGTGKFLKTVGFQFRQADDPVTVEDGIGDGEFLVLDTLLSLQTKDNRFWASDLQQHLFAGIMLNILILVVWLHCC